MPAFKFEVTSVLGKTIRLTNEYWDFIVKVKHPSLRGKEKIVELTLKDSDEVRQSASDSTVFLYYLAYNEYWICVVCRHENGEGFVITAYLTDRIKEGARVWMRK